jgi:hypothetical protein
MPSNLHKLENGCVQHPETKKVPQNNGKAFFILLLFLRAPPPLKEILDPPL